MKDTLSTQENPEEVGTLGGGQVSACEAGTKNPEEYFKNIRLAESYKTFDEHNPLITQRFGADPYAIVYKDRVYVYMTNDIPEYDEEGRLKENSYSKINNLGCISSDDLVNWTDHGIIQVGGEGGGSSWTVNSWAPAVIHKNIQGKDQFFLYYANNASSIGVLRSDSPVGPFLDPLGKPMITKQTENCADVKWLFDPAVFTDDDGRSYIYFGGGVPDGQEEWPNTARVAELGEDMISLAGKPVTIVAPYLFEDSGINKIGDTYYYTYCSNWDTRDNAKGPHVPDIADIIYMTAKSPFGPWEYQGPILKNPGRFFDTWGNNHHCMVEFKGKWYMFYHTQLLQDNMGIKGGYRCTHVDEVCVREDGRIENIKATRSGVKQLKNLNPYQLTEAETFAWMGGVSTRKAEVASPSYGAANQVLTDLKTGSWIALSDVDFGEQAPASFTARVSANNSGNLIRITVDAADGECLGYLEVPNTGSLEVYREVTIPVKGVAGVHKLFFTFCGEGFQFDSWYFKR
jgi:arabinoxylan arabinofuranohydrolase